MFDISIESEFSAAHNLRGYKGKCEKLHGHNYKVQITISGKELDNIGMLADFTILKSSLKKVLSKLDHSYLNNIPQFKQTNPTAENIARYIYNRLKGRKFGIDAKIKSVCVWESEKNKAIYFES